MERRLGYRGFQFTDPAFTGTVIHHYEGSDQTIEQMRQRFPQWQVLQVWSEGQWVKVTKGEQRG